MPMTRKRDHVLIIEDEPLVRNMLERIIAEMGYACLLAEQGDEGIRLIRENKHFIGTVIQDMFLPGTCGRELLREIKERVPEAPIILTSGEKGVNAETECDGNQIFYLPKPFDINTVKSHLAYCMDGHN